MTPFPSHQIISVPTRNDAPEQKPTVVYAIPLMTETSEKCDSVLLRASGTHRSHLVSTGNQDKSQSGASSLGEASGHRTAWTCLISPWSPGQHCDPRE